MHDIKDFPSRDKKLLRFLTNHSSSQIQPPPPENTEKLKKKASSDYQLFEDYRNDSQGIERLVDSFIETLYSPKIDPQAVLAAQNKFSDSYTSKLPKIEDGFN